MSKKKTLLEILIELRNELSPKAWRELSNPNFKNKVIKLLDFPIYYPPQRFLREIKLELVNVRGGVLPGHDDHVLWWKFYHDAIKDIMAGELKEDLENNKINLDDQGSKFCQELWIYFWPDRFWTKLESLELLSVYGDEKLDKSVEDVLKKAEKLVFGTRSKRRSEVLDHEGKKYFKLYRGHRYFQPYFQVKRMMGLTLYLMFLLRRYLGVPSFNAAITHVTSIYIQFAKSTGIYIHRSDQVKALKADLGGSRYDEEAALERRIKQYFYDNHLQDILEIWESLIQQDLLLIP